jgi:hypothetical protein
MAGEPKNPHDRLCLKAMAPLTLDVMREFGTSTSEDIATIIINKLLRTNPNLTCQETIRRRIYDIINVLSAAGLVDKVGKQVVWHPARRPIAPPAADAPSEASQDALRAKERLLCDKIRMLTLYKVLIKRNFVREPAPTAFPLPVIFLGVRDAGRTTFTQSLNRCELEIKCQRDALFLAPCDILQKVGLPRESVEGILALSPDLVRFASLVLDGAKEAE